MTQQHRFIVDRRTVTVFPGARPKAPIIYLNTFGGRGAHVLEELHQAGAPDCTLVAIDIENWNHDMAPWDCPPLSSDDVPCTGGAGDYLRLLLERIMPQAEEQLEDAPAWRGLAGYSLAGLFAVNALYHTDSFTRVASASGSFWFPHFLDYATSHPLAETPDKVYFSLGIKEAKVRNPLLQTVQKNTESLEAYFASLGITTTFQLNPGNHYVHTNHRMAEGIRWILE